MQGFKKIIAFVLANILVALALQFALAPVSNYEEQIEEFYEGDYDSIIIGSSYGNNLVAELLPDGEHVCNLSRPRVSVEDFYYIVRQLDKEKGLKRVYLDVCVSYWTGELGDSNRINMRKILTGLDELDYFLKILLKQNYNDFFFKYELDFNTLVFMPDTIREKLGMSEELPESEAQDAQPEGLVKSEVKAEPVTFAAEQILPSHVETFENLVAYCREHNIELIGFMTAFPNERLLVDNWDNAHNYFTELFQAHGLKLYDMNYVKLEHFQRPTEEYRDLEGHMLSSLAVTQSEVFAEILTAEDSSRYFEEDFETVREKIRAEEGIIS